MTARTIKISNISLSASEKDIIEFFSFSGEIEYVEMQSESERSQLAYVTFKDPQGAETAILLSGATIVDMCATIMAVENYQLPPEALERAKSAGQFSTGDSVVLKAEDVTSTMLAKGFVLGKDALSKAKEFDEKHSLTSNAAATMTSLDQKIGLSEKISVGTAVVNEKVKEVDNIFHVSDTTKSALATAEQKVSNAGSMLMKNRYILTGTSWVTNAFNKVAKAAEDVSVMTKDKMEKAEEEKKMALARERSGMVNDYAQFHFEDEPLPGEPAAVPVDSTYEGKRPGAI